METQIVHVHIDAEFIATHDALEVLDPVWWRADIYGSHEEYLRSLEPFSLAQRLFHATEWYRAEVCNGGHDQFYLNSTGIVWRDAIAGFERMGLAAYVEVLAESARRMGGEPPFDRDARAALHAELDPDFQDLDGRLFALEEEVDVSGVMIQVMRASPGEFLFEGVVEKPATA